MTQCNLESFFFSSRRRHTRFDCDWSSDVCSSDLFSSRSVTRIVERQANERGQDMATHVASLVGMYLRERRREAEALARSPAVVRAALDGSQQAISRRLPQLDTPTLEQMFNQRHVLGGDP